MKVVRKVGCGLDVHKTLIVATVATTNVEGITSYERRSFGTIYGELLGLRDWLGLVRYSSVCMESTGKYCIPVYNALEVEVPEVCLTHPKYVRAIKAKKTDKKDSKWIADLFKEDLVRASFIPSKDIRECREISHYLAKLVQVRPSEWCRYQDCLTTSNIGLGSVLSDTWRVHSFASCRRLILFSYHCRNAGLLTWLTHSHMYMTLRKHPARCRSHPRSSNTG